MMPLFLDFHRRRTPFRWLGSIALVVGLAALIVTGVRYQQVTDEIILHERANAERHEPERKSERGTDPRTAVEIAAARRISESLSYRWEWQGARGLLRGRPGNTG